MSAPPATVGNVVVSAAIRTGTVTPLIVAGRVAPTAVLFARRKAVVAMAGIAAGAMPPAVSVTCPVNGSGVVPGGAFGAGRGPAVAGSEGERARRRPRGAR